MDESQNAASDKHQNAGWFKPGVSGNPSGRPKSDICIRNLAREHTEEALSTLVEIATDKLAPQSARVSAACAILDRGWGKPMQSIEATVNAFTYYNLLSDMIVAEAADPTIPTRITVSPFSYDMDTVHNNPFKYDVPSKLDRI